MHLERAGRQFGTGNKLPLALAVRWLAVPTIKAVPVAGGRGGVVAWLRSNRSISLGRKGTEGVVVVGRGGVHLVERCFGLVMLERVSVAQPG